MSQQLNITSLYYPRMINVYHGLSFKELQALFSYDIRSLSYGRNTLTALIHINAYMRTLKTPILKLYNIGFKILTDILNDLLAAGYIKMVVLPGQSNIGALVPRNCYYITRSGRDLLNKLDDLLHLKLSKLKK